MSLNKDQSLVFINQSSGYLMVDIINSFSEKYQQLVLITGDLNIRNRKLSPKVKVHQIVRPDRSTKSKRIFSWLIGYLQITWLVLTKYRKNCRLFLVSNPPLFTFYPFLNKREFSILIYDIYPDVLVNFGYVRRKSWLVKYWQYRNKKVFSSSTSIFTISNGMKRILTNYVKDEKVKVVPIWSDAEFLKPIPKVENQFLHNLGLTDQFVVQYSGNLGRTHDVEVLVELANELRHENDLHFLIIGQGDKWNMLESRIREYKLKNCTLLPWQPVEVLPQSLAAPDIGVVSLGSEASKMSVPSKTFNLFSVGVPILAIAANDSELAGLLDKYKAGITLLSSQRSEIKDFILALKNDKTELDRYQSNSLAASEDFTPENAKLFVA